MPSPRWSLASTARAPPLYSHATAAAADPPPTSRPVPASSTRPRGRRPPRPTARPLGRSPPCEKRYARRETACQLSPPTRSGMSCTKPATATNAQGPGAPPALPCASARLALSPSPTRTPSPKKADRGRLRPGQATGAVGVVRRPGGAFPHRPPLWPELAALGQPSRQPHEYIRNGTAKVMTLFHPASGQVRVEGVTSCPNEVLNGWLKRELSTVLARLPDPPPTATASRAAWERWQQGLTTK